MNRSTLLVTVGLILAFLVGAAGATAQEPAPPESSVPDDTWHVETIDPYGGGNPRTSIAVDTHGHPHISYADLGLYYAEFDGSQWHTTRIDNNTIKSTFEQGRETGL